MNLSYDECLGQNPFFQAIQTKHGDIIKKAAEEDWIICIPRLETIESSSISAEDVLEQVLIPNPELPSTHFCTLTKRELTVQDKFLVFKTDEANTSVRILFEETFYIDRSQKFKLWCIERPLHHSAVSNYEGYCIKNVHDCVKLLWTKDSSVLEGINKLTENFLSDRFEFDNLEVLREKTSALHANCSVILKENDDVANLAVETYVHHCVHNKLFQAVCNYTSQGDVNLNKILRNVSHLELKDLDVGNEFFDGITIAKREVANFNKYSTVLGKVECLRRIVNVLAGSSNESQPRNKSLYLTTDDLIKIFVFLIIKSSLNNWVGNLMYVSHFRFSFLSASNENSFLITTLEAAIEYIKSGALFVENFVSVDDHSLITGIGSLFECVKVGNLEVIRKYFDSKALIVDKILACHPLCSCDKCESSTPFSINGRDEGGCTALHVACLHGQPHVVEYLINRRVEVDVANHSESTPLHYAALKGHQNALLLLLHADAQVAVANSDGNTPLHLAANNGHENCVKALLYFLEQKGHFVDVNSENNSGDTPLHFAARWGYAGIVHILLQYGGDVGIRNKRGQTALDVVHNDYLRKLLLTADRENSQTFRRNMLVGFNKRKNVSPKSVEQMKRVDSLLKSIENNDLPLMCFYLGIPSPQTVTNLTTKSTCHPLCTCEQCRKHFENNSSSTPSASGKALNVNICNSDGYTPLHVAAKCGLKDILRLLLDCGASVNTKTYKYFYTPLHLACRNQKIEVVREILKCGGCSLDVQDCKGNTPLHYACTSSDSRIVELLLSQGSDCNMKNGGGKTPLQEAKGRMLCNIVKLLKDKRENADRYENVSNLFSL